MLEIGIDAFAWVVMVVAAAVLFVFDDSLRRRFVGGTGCSSSAI